jgi:RNA polymerase sigma-70 factor (ECF subfamily)
LFNDILKKKYKGTTEEKLVILAQKNDYEALEELIRRVQKNIYSSFYYLNAEKENLSDLTQEALLRMSKNIKNLKNPKLFRSWLGHIVSNLFYDEQRKKQKQYSYVSLEHFWAENEDNKEYGFEICDNTHIPEETTNTKELNRVIKHHICALPENFRVVIILREIQGLSYDEIAKITKTNIGTVKSRISRARIKLQEHLKPYLN